MSPTRRYFPNMSHSRTLIGNLFDVTLRKMVKDTISTALTANNKEFEQLTYMHAMVC